MSRTGQFSEDIKWKISGRFDYDAAYDLSNFYPSAVRRDQRYEFFLRENYLDVSAGDFDFRLGRQHVIWGEMVGLFFADVVSAKDMREFVLPSFDIIRIPQWAMRAEYSKNDIHAEVGGIPVPTLDESGKPGADFYPGPLRGSASFLPEDRSGRNVAHSNYGVRLSQLKMAGIFQVFIITAWMPLRPSIGSAHLPNPLSSRRDTMRSTSLAQRWRKTSAQSC